MHPDQRPWHVDAGLWALVLASAGGCAFGAYQASTIPKFEKMFASIGGKLPLITHYMLSVPWLVWAVLPWAACAASVVILLESDRSAARVIAACFGALIVWVLVAFVKLGIQVPIWELERALS